MVYFEVSEVRGEAPTGYPAPVAGKASFARRLPYQERWCYMAKVKIKCASCGKSFKSPDPKKTLCPDCQAARKAAPSTAKTPVTVAPPAGPAIDLRAAFKAAQEAGGSYAAYRPAPTPPAPPEPLPAAPVAPPAGPLGRPHPQGEPARGGAARPFSPRGVAGGSLRPARPPAPPRPPKERKPPTPPFQPSPEQVDAVRTRYLELAQPEFDGIRHQIATELAIPIRAVKSVVKELRTEMNMPSWWELAMATLTDEQRAAVRALYLPLLPLPPIGVHKQLAETLGLKQLAVYSTIRSLREELSLPRFNDRPDRPASHAGADPAQDEQNGDQPAAAADTAQDREAPLGAVAEAGSDLQRPDLSA